MGLFGSRRAAGNPHRPDPSGEFTAEHEAMGAVARPRRGLFGGGKAADAMMVLGAALQGGESMPAVIDLLGQRREAEAAEAQRRALMAQAASLFPDDPRAQFLFAANPKAFTDAIAERYKPMQVTGGNTVLNGPGEKPYMAPKVEKFDDRFGVFEDGQASYTEARSPTFQENTGRRSADETARHNLILEQLGFGNLGVAQGNLGLGWARHNARSAAGGYGTPGAGAAMMGEWEEF